MTKSIIIDFGDDPSRVFRGKLKCYVNGSSVSVETEEGCMIPLPSEYDTERTLAIETLYNLRVQETVRIDFWQGMKRR